MRTVGRRAQHHDRVASILRPPGVRDLGHAASERHGNSLDRRARPPMLA